MKERPIIFSGPMIPPILAGTKTQTRRIVKPRADRDFGSRCVLQPHEIAGEINAGDLRNSVYGALGDRLWVRETWAWSGDSSVPEFQFVADGEVWYRADPSRNSPAIYWRPSIHMPRWASRITLEITDVRVERVQDISVEDCRAEGGMYSSPVDVRAWYRDLWESLHGDGSWAANPWVWVIGFRKVEA